MSGDPHSQQVRVDPAGRLEPRPQERRRTVRLEPVGDQVVTRTVDAGDHRGDECFVSDDLTRDLRVKDCVEVTYNDPTDPQPEPAPLMVLAFRVLDEKSHPEACPGF